MDRAVHVVVLAGAVVACARPAGDEITFHADVAPILTEHCHTCHRPDGIGSFALQDYDEAKAWDVAIVDAVESRRMPPYPASAECNDYIGAMGLSDEEIATIAGWVDAGSPPGDEADAPAPWEPEPGLAAATHSAVMPEPYTPDATLDDDYRCFLIDPGVTGSTHYLTAYEVVPGNERLVHHIVAYATGTQEVADEAIALDEADPGPGYSCPGTSGVDDATLAVAWSPGGRVVVHPEGTGVPLEPGLPLIMQVHYHSDGVPESDQTTLNLAMSETVESPLYPVFYAFPPTLILAPGNEAASQEVAFPFGDFLALARPELAGRAATIHGVRGHMHGLGREFRLEAAGSCLLHVPDYDWDWQYSYFFEQPVRLETTDVVTMTCTYDTTGLTETTTWGNGTEDEMCLGTLYAVFDE